jgi:RND family efflux transporter MFP subunit
VEVGNNVMPGEPAVKLVTVDNVKVSVSVPESEISGISLGDDVEIVVAALGGQSFTGKIKEKGVAANALSRSYEVKAEIRNPSNALLPGMLCSLYLSGSKAESSAILVPRHAVRLASDNRDFVWVNAGGKAIRKYVELGAFAGDRVAVASGLADGDQVVVEGQQKISDNMSVTVIK